MKDDKLFLSTLDFVCPAMPHLVTKAAQLEVN